jgi:dolichol kinase
MSRAPRTVSMMLALTHFLDDFSAFVVVLDPGRTAWESLPERLHARARELLAEVERLRSEPRAGAVEGLDAALRSTAASLEALVEGLRQRLGATDGQRLYGHLARSYEQLARCARSLEQREARPRQLSPVNYVRNVFHVAMGLTAALTYRLALDRVGAALVIGSLALFLTFLEVLRRRSVGANAKLMRAFGRIARPHEYYRVNSSTWYAWGILFAVLLFPPIAVQLGCLVLGIADPLASLVGRRFGRVKLVRDRSVAGTLAFLLGGALASLAFLAALYPELSVARVLLLALAAAVGGGIAETFSRRLDDNFTIPLASSAGVAVALAALT